MSRPSQQLQLASFALTVHDLTEALGFYRDVLGFNLYAESAATRRVSVSLPPPPDLQLFLQSPATTPGVSPTDRQLIENLMANGLLGQHLVFLTDNCDTTFEHLEASGAEVMQEPISRPNGTRDCAFLDPSANLLRFTQRPSQLPWIRVRGEVWRNGGSVGAGQD